MESWAEKYRPQSLSDIIGNTKVINDLKSWAGSWGEKMVKKFTTMYYYGKSADKESRRDLKIARSFGKTASLRQTKKGFVLRVGRR